MLLLLLVVRDRAEVCVVCTRLDIANTDVGRVDGCCLHRHILTLGCPSNMRNARPGLQRWRWRVEIELEQFFLWDIGVRSRWRLGNAAAALV